MRLRTCLLLGLLIVPGVMGAAFCFYHALIEWAALQQAQGNFERIASNTSNLNALFVAEAKQNIHRINLFAEVVWALLCAILAAIGLHGLCYLGRKNG